MKILKSAAFLLCGLLASQPCRAEPTPKIEQFMDMKVSLFSFGLFRLQEYLQNALYEGGGARLMPPLPLQVQYLSSVQYDWDQNRLVILAYRFAMKTDNSWSPEEECSQVFSYLRLWLGVDRKTGRPADGVRSSLSGFFSPMGYDLSALKRENFDELDNITRLRFYTIAEAPAKIECEAPLLGNSYSVVKSSQ